ncbi:hypothetical protein FACS189450_06550 [Spirochaetia bacterium]|nr:hypothetical protein FACS189450_06550 [Spirochaetia bacterium]
MNTEIVFEWDEEKRQRILAERGLDIVILAPILLDDPNVVIKQDIRRNYPEDRFLAWGLVDGTRLCLCFTPRNDKIHLITIFKMHKKQWEKHYGRKIS